MPPISQVHKTLWTPEGEHWSKDIIPINRNELIMLSRLHEFAHKYGITVVCKQCNSAITGQNNDSTPTPAVHCQCREFRYTAG